VDPSAAIFVIETELRGLVRTVFTQSGSPSRWKDSLGADSVAALAKRHKEEAARRRPAVVPQDLLAYTHFYEVRKIIEKNWTLFSAALGVQKEFKVWADQIEDFRNAPAHSRELLPHERALLEGIAGVGPDMNHYPLIESASDSFGNAFEKIVEWGHSNILVTGLRLRPGQTVTFSARAWDPQGRDLHWRLITRMRTISNAVGSDVSLEWTVSESDVAMLCVVELQVTSSGSFHRHQTFDHVVNFQYVVDPPDET
jgi:hypothetical protein